MVFRNFPVGRQYLHSWLNSECELIVTRSQEWKPWSVPSFYLNVLGPRWTGHTLHFCIRKGFKNWIQNIISMLTHKMPSNYTTFEFENPLKFSLYLSLSACKLHQLPLGRGHWSHWKVVTHVCRSDLRQRSVSAAWLLNHALARNMILMERRVPTTLRSHKIFEYKRSITKLLTPLFNFLHCHATHNTRIGSKL